jgi:hypothetical protein
MLAARATDVDLPLVGALVGLSDTVLQVGAPDELLFARLEPAVGGVDPRSSRELKPSTNCPPASS